VTDSAIRNHCAEINRCNQRGGRMLSIVDLIQAGTISRDLAAYALAAIGNGASFLVGAMPGGAGKTTVMGALLNFVPFDVRLAPADGIPAIERGVSNPAPRRCYICHEIGSGHYYAYLWGRALRAYFDLPQAGHMLATNLHADTYEQARAQICGDNDVSVAALQRMNLMFFLSIGRSGLGIRRRIETVWESSGRGRHRRIFAAGSPEISSEVALAESEDIERARDIVDQLLDSRARTIEEVRTVILKVRNGR